MYESFFELRVKPFELLPDPKFIYLSKSHKKALTYLDYGIRERAGFILLTGEIGSGKTTLIRDLIDKNHEHAVLAKIFNTHATSEQLLAMINDDFGLPTGGMDRVTLIRELNAFLVEQYGLGNQPILIIDEAQNLPPELLEEVRMLSNLESAESKLLQIILVGQPELRTILSSPALRQLRQRIAISCHLQALCREETERYILHRLEIAGNAAAVEFSAESLDLVFFYSKGIPRLVNIICDFILLAAFAEETKTVSAGMVCDIAADLDFDNQYWGESLADDGTTGSNPSREEKIKDLLKRIVHRLDALEKRQTTLDQKRLNEIDQRMEKVEQRILGYMSTTAAEIGELKKYARAMMKGGAVGAASQEEDGERKQGKLEELLHAS